MNQSEQPDSVSGNDEPGSASDVRSVARTYMEAWRARDFDRLRSVLADDVTFRGPLGEADGADDCIEGLRGMATHVMQDIEVRVIADHGNDVLTWFDLHSEHAAPVPTVNWSHVEAGRITRIRVTFDPRPLVSSDPDE